jgi:hypothetical protein
MLTIVQRRLELKIDVLKRQFADVAHARDLLRHAYVHARAGSDPDLTVDLANKIQACNRQIAAIGAEIRSLSHRRYWTGEPHHDALPAQAP